MKTMFLAAALTLAALPAFAQEGNGNPFPFKVPGATTIVTHRQVADVGSSRYPDIRGLPGSVISVANADVIPTNASEAPVQTANSLPRGFDEGTIGYASLPQPSRTGFAGLFTSRR